MNTPGNTLELANSYIRALYCGLILTMAYNVSSSILRAIGDSRTPLYFLILSSFLNIALDIIFIVVFKLGTAGGVVELVCRLSAIRFLLAPLGYWCVRLTNPITWIFTCIMFTGSYFWWEMNARKQQPDKQPGLLTSNIDNL
ncbi:MatE protein [Anaerobium acetethylicum]|uniref:MatE protein n=1 Tax=Anaerobium acetethylicum TaxID=1619234 RepID=A0A1D3TV66_9FIRM|nr:MATE family efflux transporter [Anaerobium acetethylicum]SCP98009.1 MatE protein [Anaerobium acetethylicum]